MITNKISGESGTSGWILPEKSRREFDWAWIIYLRWTGWHEESRIVLGLFANWTEAVIAYFCCVIFLFCLELWVQLFHVRVAINHDLEYCIVRLNIFSITADKTFHSNKNLSSEVRSNFEAVILYTISGNYRCPDMHTTVSDLNHQTTDETNPKRLVCNQCLPVNGR